jgi:2-polyprenyl-6-methoxyphenol hydroxylase-like FAD-dependent oxidoreductase
MSIDTTLGNLTAFRRLNRLANCLPQYVELILNDTANATAYTLADHYTYQVLLHIHDVITMPISVIVIGAGPVGLMTALRLAQANVQVTCLEAEIITVRSPRAMVYHPIVTKEFERSGILDDVRERGSRSESVCWKISKTGEVIAKLEMGAGDLTGRESLVIGQDDLSDIILEHLDKYEHCKIMYGHRVVALNQLKAGDGTNHHQQPSVITCLEGSDTEQQFSADYIVGADGGRSTIRRLLEIPFNGFTYEDDQLVAANLRIPRAPDTWSDANFCVDPESDWGLVARIRDGLWRMAYKEDEGLSEAQMRDRLPSKLSRLSGGQVIEDVQIEMLAPYRLQQRCAATFLKGRVVLAGDAAHLCNPFGAFGLTSGLLDATALADALIAIHSGKASSDALEYYAAERRRVFTGIVNPLSQANKERLHDADPSTLGSRDPFLRRIIEDNLQASSEKRKLRQPNLATDINLLGRCT